MMLVPKKMVTFVPQPRYVNEDMFTTDNRTMLAHLHNWIELSAAARGYVQVADREKFSDLGDPYTVAIDRHTDGPGYMMSVFHQLHCLVCRHLCSVLDMRNGMGFRGTG